MIVSFNFATPTSFHVFRYNEDSCTTELAGMLVLHEGEWRFGRFGHFNQLTDPVSINGLVEATMQVEEHRYPSTDLLSVLQLVQELVCSS